MGLISFLQGLAESSADPSRRECATKGCTRPVALNPWSGEPQGRYCGGCRSARKCGIDPSK